MLNEEREGPNTETYHCVLHAKIKARSTFIGKDGMEINHYFGIGYIVDSLMYMMTMVELYLYFL